MRFSACTTTSTSKGCERPSYCAIAMLCIKYALLISPNTCIPFHVFFISLAIAAGKARTLFALRGFIGALPHKTVDTGR